MVGFIYKGIWEKLKLSRYMNHEAKKVPCIEGNYYPRSLPSEHHTQLHTHDLPQDSSTENRKLTPLQVLESGFLSWEEHLARNKRWCDRWL